MVNGILAMAVAMRFFMGQGVGLLCPKKTIVMPWMNSKVSRRQRAEKLYDDLANLLAQLGGEEDNGEEEVANGGVEDLFWDLQQLIWERPWESGECASQPGAQVCQ